MTLFPTTTRAWDDNRHGRGFNSPITGMGSPCAALSRSWIKRARNPPILVVLSMRMPQVLSQRLIQVDRARLMTSSLNAAKDLVRTADRIFLPKFAGTDQELATSPSPSCPTCCRRAQQADRQNCRKRLLNCTSTQVD